MQCGHWTCGTKRAVCEEGCEMRTKFRLPWSAYEMKLERLDQTALGAELPDDTPIAPPVGYVKQPSLIETVRNMVRSEHLRRAALEADAETFEEAEDFDVEDEVNPVSAYEWEPSFEPPAPYTVSPSPKAADTPGGGGSDAEKPPAAAPEPVEAPITEPVVPPVVRRK